MITLTEELPATANGRKRWSRDECKVLKNAGLLKGRYELLDGEIVSKMGRLSPHAIAVSRIVAYSIAIFGKHHVLVHYGVNVAAKDQMLNWLDTDLVAYEHPVQVNENSNSVLLAVEVSDTTQADDYGPKVGLYARACVAEYWILDLTRRVLVVYRSPQQGQWLVRDEYAPGTQIAPLTMPNNPISVDQLLPPLAEAAD